MINPQTISLDDFTIYYNLPGDFYDIIRLVKSKLNITVKLNVVIIIDDFLMCANSEQGQIELINNIYEFIDKQRNHADLIISADLILTSDKQLSIIKCQNDNRRGYRLLLLHPLADLV